MVHGLVRHAARDGAVADDRDDVVALALGIAAHRHAQRRRDARRRVARAKGVVLALAALHEACAAPPSAPAAQRDVSASRTGLSKQTRAARAPEMPPYWRMVPILSRRPVSILCTYAWWPTSQRKRSAGQSNTWCSATVSSTTPSELPRWPPVCSNSLHKLVQRIGKLQHASAIRQHLSTSTVRGEGHAA